MAIDTILDFENARFDTETQALEDARALVTNAAKAAADASEKVATLGKAATKEADAGVAIRRALAAAVEATSAEALVQELADHEIRARGLAAQLTNAQYTAAIAKAALARATAEVARAEKATAGATQSTTKAKQRADAWKKHVTDVAQQLWSRTSAFADAVQAVLDSAAYKKAKERVHAEVPQALRDEARERIKTVRDSAGDVARNEENAATAVSQRTGAVAAALLTAEREDHRVRALVNAERDLQDAETLIAGINTAPTLSEALQNKIDGLEPTIDAATEARDDAEKAVSDHEQKIADKQAEIENPPAGAVVATLKSELRALKAALGPLEKAVEDAKLEYARVANVVPEDAWRRLLQFDDVTLRLTELKKLTPQKIKDISDGYKSAEKTLAGALKTEADARRAADAEQRTLAECRDRATAGRELAQALVLVALRSDA